MENLNKKNKALVAMMVFGLVALVKDREHDVKNNETMNQFFRWMCGPGGFAIEDMVIMCGQGGLAIEDILILIACQILNGES